MALECRVGVIEGFNVSVDDFREKPNVKAYFLSHCHTDHTRGLSSTFWKGHRPEDPLLYCSKASKRIVQHLFGISSSRIVVLTPKTWVKLDITQSTLPGAQLQVYCADANHCVGSLVFLFSSSFASVIHTGDFRAHSALVQNSVLTSASVDYLYLDDTYLDSRFTFPDRREVSQQVVQIVRNHPDHKVFVAVDNIGKEELLVLLAAQFQTKVVCTQSRFELLKVALGWNEERTRSIFTTDPSQGFIHISSRRELTSQFLHSQPFPCIGVFPSAWAFIKDTTSDASDTRPLYHVPYSLHSAFHEITAFVQAVRPKRIIPITSATNERITEYFGEEFCFTSKSKCESAQNNNSGEIIVRQRDPEKGLVLVNRAQGSPSRRPTNVLGGSCDIVFRVLENRI